MNPWIETHMDRKRIADFCRRWRITEMALFGSVLRDDFGPTSDVDVLLTFEPDAAIGLFGLMRARDELAAEFGRSVDVIERPAIERSPNWIRRKAILDSAKVIYGS